MSADGEVREEIVESELDVFRTGRDGYRATDEGGDLCSIAKPVDVVMLRWSGRGRSTVAAGMNFFLVRG